MSSARERVEKGAANLLANCAGIRKHDRLLVVHEESGLRYYDDKILCAISHAAQAIGADVTLKQVSFDPLPTEMPADLRALMRSADQAVFLARRGDQLRFCDMESKERMTVCYALDIEMLASAYGTADHRAFIEIKTAVNRMLGSAQSIHVTCPCGTDFRGPGPGTERPLADVAIKRFPMSVFTPIPAERYSGTVALPGFLVGTGSMYYEPYAIEYEGALSVTFEAGRIVRFNGSAAAVRSAEQHYQMVADRLGIDRDFVHSWHAGIHPGCEFSSAASDSYERWSGAAFGNPRLLHFHTCGAYAPGEISWNVIDPTIMIDGIPVWQDGVLRLRLVPGGDEILAQHPEIAVLFDAPKQSIGL